MSLPFEFFQKRGPHEVGDANKFMARCALNLEEHGVRYAGLDRSAVGSCKYFTALALSKGVGLRFSGHSRSIPIAALQPSKDVTAVTGVLFDNASFFGQRTLGMLLSDGRTGHGATPLLLHPKLTEPRSVPLH